MPTKYPRLNIVLDPEIQKSLTSIAKKSKQSQSAVASTLIRTALELQEDYLDTELLKQRRQKPQKIHDHQDVWK